jgi:hypothetical protein
VAPNRSPAGSVHGGIIAQCVNPERAPESGRWPRPSSNRHIASDPSRIRTGS